MRRTIEVDLDQALIEKEPITVLLSEKGWIRALKGHPEDLSKLEFKNGDSLKRVVRASTTDKLILFATNGKFFTLEGNELPGGRGHGEPVRLMVDLEENHELVELFVHEPGRKLVVAATSGHGFIVAEDEVVASTRKGKQVLNVEADAEARICVPVPPGADTLATVGENRRMLVFALDEVNEMTRGKGIILQRFKDGGLSRCPSLRQGGRPDMARSGGADLHAFRPRIRRVGGAACPGRTNGAQGFPALEPLRSRFRVVTAFGA